MLKQLRKLFSKKPTPRLSRGVFDVMCGGELLHVEVTCITPATVARLTNLLKANVKFSKAVSSGAAVPTKTFMDEAELIMAKADKHFNNARSQLFAKLH